MHTDCVTVHVVARVGPMWRLKGDVTDTWPLERGDVRRCLREPGAALGGEVTVERPR